MNYRQQLTECHQRIAPHIHRTPVLTSQLIDQACGCQVFFKCENFQRMGAFKMRGALNALLSLPAEKQSRGVVTHSSGNMAQAVALAAQSVGIPAYIVMPANAPQVKKDAVRGYGGNIFEVEPTIEARQAKADEISQDTGATFIHPSNQIEVILGQGTAGLELIQEQPELEVLLVPVGGGGLIAGCSLASHFFGDNLKCIGGEPRACDDAFRSLASGKIETNKTADTIADGLRTVLGDVNFPIIQNYVERIICVDETEIVSAMKLIWERMKIVIEPSSAVPFAALCRDKQEFGGKKVGIIISGGNVDLAHLPFGND